MKKFDKTVMTTIDKMSNMDDWSNVNWRQLKIKLFKSKDTPGKYRGTILNGPADWLRFVQRYSMNKVNIDPKWLECKRSNHTEPVNKKEEDHFTMADVLRDALKEIGVNNDVAGSSKVS